MRQILVHFCSEKLLKCKIRVEIDISFYDTFRSHGYSHLIMSYPTKILNYSHKSIFYLIFPPVFAFHEKNGMVHE